MGNLCSNIVNTSDIDVLDYTPKDDSYEYMRPRGKIIVQIDEKVRVLILGFDGCIPKHVRFWPQSTVQQNQFLYLDRTLLFSPEGSVVSENVDSGYNTVL